MKTLKTTLCALSCLVASSAAHAATDAPFNGKVYDPVKTELVLNLVVTCTDPVRPGPEGASKDGERTEIWPIIGGRFDGPGIHGTVEAGGADLPVLRPDGVEVVDAFYRLKTDDGQIIVIHNKGLAYPIDGGKDYKYRLSPEFIAPKGKYDWLNKSIFVATLVYPVPKGMELAKGPHQNDRLIQVLRLN